jgi:hypothetical protein
MGWRGIVHFVLFFVPLVLLAPIVLMPIGWNGIIAFEMELM